MDPNYMDPVIFDELRQDMEEEMGETIREGDVIDMYPEVFDWLENRDHDFIEDMYDDIGSDINRSETIITTGEVPILVEDITYNSRQWDNYDIFIKSLFDGGETLDKETLVRGHTFYQKYQTVDGLLGIKRKKYKVKDTSEGKLAIEQDKTLKFDKSYGRTHLEGQPYYEEPKTEWKGLFDLD